MYEQLLLPLSVRVSCGCLLAIVASLITPSLPALATPPTYSTTMLILFSAHPPEIQLAVTRKIIYVKINKGSSLSNAYLTPKES